MWCLLYCKVWFRPGRLHIDVMVFTIKFSLIVTMYAYAVSLSFVPQITSPWDHWLHEWQWVSVVLLFQVRKLKKEKKTLLHWYRNIENWNWDQCFHGIPDCRSYVVFLCSLLLESIVFDLSSNSITTLLARKDSLFFFPGALTKLP